MTTNNPDIIVLKAAVRGCYDLQKLRMATGLRLCANFRAKLELIDTPVEPGDEEETDDAALALKKKRDAEAESVVKLLKVSYARLTDGIAKNLRLPAKKGFVGDELISTHAELTLVDQYMTLVQDEARQFRQLVGLLEPIPIYSQYLEHVDGVGPAMAGVLISYLNPYKANYVSSFWRYAGLDVGPDGHGRSLRKEHMVERQYYDKNKKLQTKMGLTYEPFLKTKLAGVLAGSFVKQTKSPWRAVYDGYKHRLQTDPNREKVTSAEWKKRRSSGEDVTKLWTPGRINNAAKRYMIKQFLAALWVEWRTMEGLPTPAPYAVAKMGMAPHSRLAVA